MKPIHLLFVAALAAGCATVHEGPSAPLPVWSAGDYWVYDEINGYNGDKKRSFRVEVSSVKSDEVALRTGDRTTTYDSAWDWLGRSFADGRVFEYRAARPHDSLQPGATWKQKLVAIEWPSGVKRELTEYGTVRGWERVKVPAGEFDALKVHRYIFVDDSDWWRSGTYINDYDWYVPQVGRFIRHENQSEYYEINQRPPNRRRGDWTITELVSYQAKAPAAAAK